MLQTFFQPLFQGPDEAIHYGTVQFLAEPQEKNWAVHYLEDPQHIVEDIRSYQLPEETVLTAVAVEFDGVKHQSENTQTFLDSAFGINEETIVSNSWKPYIDVYPHNASGTKSLYYLLGAELEKSLSEASVITRFTAMRLLSVALGALVVALAYLTFRKIGFSPLKSLLITSLVTFQPMFAMISANVNIDIMLILSFALFTYAAVCLLKEGLNIRDTVLLLGSLVLGFYSKGPGAVLIVVSLPFLAYLAIQRFNISKKRVLQGLAGGIILLTAALSLFAGDYVKSITRFGETTEFSSTFASIAEYADKSLSLDALRRSHASYWGHFGWLDTKISEPLLSVIWTIEVIALLGLLVFLHSKEKLPYLPEKKYIYFSLGLILALQLAIRFYDWRVFSIYGEILIGTPGRYFLPNIIPHMLLLVTGLGYWVKNEKQFHILLKTLALGMMLLALYSLINVIIPRYYL